MNTFDKIRNWAHERNLIDGSTTEKQMIKLVEEIGELATAVNNKDIVEMIDAIGDCVVVLTILSQKNGLCIEDCIDEAYDEIKDRKGRMIDGIFVKEPDLKKL